MIISVIRGAYALLIFGLAAEIIYRRLLLNSSPTQIAPPWVWTWVLVGFLWAFLITKKLLVGNRFFRSR